LAGRLYDRFGPALVVSAGGILWGSSLALTGLVQNLWQYYLSFGVLGAAGIAFIMVPTTAAVSRRFPRSRGTAISIISAGASSSALIFYPLITWLIASLGWRGTFEVYGLVVVLGVVPLTLLAFRKPLPVTDPASGSTRISPSHSPVSKPTLVTESSVAPDHTLGEAMRTAKLWAVFIMWGLGVIGYQIMTTQQVAHALDRGFDATTIALMFSLAGGLTTAGSLIGGALSDRWGREWIFSLGSLIAVIGIASFSFLAGPDDLGKLLVYAMAGMGFGIRIPLLWIIVADLFHGKHMGAILGFANGGGGLGGFIGPMLGGYIYDISGDYQLAFGVSALAILGSMVAAWVAGPRKARAG
jgi:MFS family permease